MKKVAVAETAITTCRIIIAVLMAGDDG